MYERGFSTGLEAISFDEAIRAAGVSRTSAYRRWPRRDRFYGDVMLELATGTALPSPDAGVLAPTLDVVRHHSTRLDSAQAQRNLVVEVVRSSLDVDHDLIRDSPEWRTFRTLQASYQGIADLSVRREVETALAAAERQAIDARARVYAQFSALFGYRLMAPLAGPDGYELMSRAAGAMMTGLMIAEGVSAATMPPARTLRAFGSTEAVTWRPQIYMAAGVVLSYLEPDPGVDWNQLRVDDLVTALTDLQKPGTTSDPLAAPHP